MRSTRGRPAVACGGPVRTLGISGPGLRRDPNRWMQRFIGALVLSTRVRGYPPVPTCRTKRSSNRPCQASRRATVGTRVAEAGVAVVRGCLTSPTIMKYGTGMYGVFFLLLSSRRDMPVGNQYFFFQDQNAK